MSSGGLFVFGSGNRSKPLQNDDIQSVFLFLRRTGNKKGASEKGSFVRIFPFQYIPFSTMVYHVIFIL